MTGEDLLLPRKRRSPVSQGPQPGGRLPLTWFKNDYIHKIPMTSMELRPVPKHGYPGRTYKFYQGLEVPYPFGYGLNYTKFLYKTGTNGTASRWWHSRGCPCGWGAGVAPQTCGSRFLWLQWRWMKAVNLMMPLLMDQRSMQVQIQASTEPTFSPLQAEAHALVLAARVTQLLQISQPTFLTDNLSLAKAAASKNVLADAIPWELYFMLYTVTELNEVGTMGAFPRSKKEKTAYSVVQSGVSTVLIDKGAGSSVSFPVKIKFTL
uniref:Putative beta-D-xylosidase 2 n=1 Tax=Aegilops tauschii TaxID=37682 RepID=N1QRP3_AEGTA